MFSATFSSIINKIKSNLVEKIKSEVKKVLQDWFILIVSTIPALGFALSLLLVSFYLEDFTAFTGGTLIKLLAAIYIYMYINYICPYFNHKYPLLYLTLTLLCVILIMFDLEELRLIWNGMLKMFSGFGGSNPQGGEGSGSGSGGPDPGRNPGPRGGFGQTVIEPEFQEKYERELRQNRENKKLKNEKRKIQNEKDAWDKLNTELEKAKQKEKQGVSFILNGQANPGALFNDPDAEAERIRCNQDIKNLVERTENKSISYDIPPK